MQTISEDLEFRYFMGMSPTACCHDGTTLSDDREPGTLFLWAHSPSVGGSLKLIGATLLRR